MDSNTTRRGRKTKRLTQNQFKRHMSKIPYAFPCKATIDLEPVIYIMLLGQAVLDLKALGHKENVKYPISVIYLSIYKLLDFFIRDFSIQKSKRLAYADYYITLNRMEKSISLIMGKLTYLMLGTVQKFDKLGTIQLLEELGTQTADLCVSLDIDLEHISFLSVDFFAKIVPPSNLLDHDSIANRLADFRTLYLNTLNSESYKTSKIQSLLIEQFEEVENG